MDNERTAVITIGEEEYTLLLTTKATKEIAGRYGGLENLGEKLMKSENFEMAIGEIVWLITLLANLDMYSTRTRTNMLMPASGSSGPKIASMIARQHSCETIT